MLSAAGTPQLPTRASPMPPARAAGNRGMDMHRVACHESPRRRCPGVGAAGMALASVLVLGACRAEGGGFIGDPSRRPGRCLPGRCDFGFNFTCEMDVKKNRSGCDQGRDHLPRQPQLHHPRGRLEPTLFPEIRLHGTVEPLIVPNVSIVRGGGRGLSRRPCSRAPTGLRIAAPGYGGASSSSRCSTRVSRAARAGRSPGTASPSS